MNSNEINALRAEETRKRAAARQKLDPSKKQFINIYYDQEISPDMVDESTRRYKQCSECGKVYVKPDTAGGKYVLARLTKRGVHKECASSLEQAVWPNYPFDS